MSSTLVWDRNCRADHGPRLSTTAPRVPRHSIAGVWHGSKLRLLTSFVLLHGCLLWAMLPPHAPKSGGFLDLTPQVSTAGPSSTVTDRTLPGDTCRRGRQVAAQHRILTLDLSQGQTITLTLIWRTCSEPGPTTSREAITKRTCFIHTSQEAVANKRPRDFGCLCPNPRMDKPPAEGGPLTHGVRLRSTGAFTRVSTSRRAPRGSGREGGGEGQSREL